MSSKRRAGAASPPGALQSGAKRRKVSSEVGIEEETPQRTTELGLELLSQIKQITDRNGRLVVTEFLRLPNRKEHPGYYDAVKLPIALETVEVKLKQFDYPTVTTLESDLRRMISNAKSYNDKSSLIFADAERIRKMLVATMPGINPAYKDFNYAAFPTPIPTTSPGERAEGATGVKTEDDTTESLGSTRRPSRHSRTTSVPEENTRPHDSFEGSSLQAAQDKIISELIYLKDSDGNNIASPFVHKPDRNVYKDYYEIIQHPVSLRGIQKQVRGIEGRKIVHRQTTFTSWQAFEAEVEFIWRNAREFNEDGSEIVALAGFVEDHFRRRVEEAKKAVPDLVPPADDKSVPRLRLKMKSGDTPAQKLMLRLSEQTDGSDTPEDRTRAGSTGQQSHTLRSSPSARNIRRSAVSPLSTYRRAMDNNESKTRVASDCPPEHSPITQSGHDTQPESAEGSAAPDTREDSHELQKVASDSPLPKGTASVAESAASRKDSGRSWLWSTVANPITHLPSHISPLDCVLRQSKEDLSRALISNVHISTHPSLNLGHEFVIDVSASSALSQQSVMINLPSTHNFICLRPCLTSVRLQKQSKMVALLGSQRLQGTVGLDSSADRPLYEIRLNHGVTRIDFEMIAAPSRGIPKVGLPGSDIEYERLTLYFNLLR